MTPLTGTAANSSTSPPPASLAAASAPVQSVQILSSTWARDSHNLFDFEANQLQKQFFEATSRSTQFIRCGTDVQMTTDHGPLPFGAERLIRLVQHDGAFWVDKVVSSSSKKPWLVVRDLAERGHHLSEGDTIKFGRFKFRVRQMARPGDDMQKPAVKLDDNGIPCTVDSGHVEDLQDCHCRVCLLDGSTDEDPLIRPCACKGSIEHVHLGCLRHWVRGRLNLREHGPQGAYVYRPLLCELCKSPYPTHVTIGGKNELLVEVPKTEAPFIVLESMAHESHNFHVVSLAESKKLKFGRGHESDVRIPDVSISRCHATIRYDGGCFILEDNDSKFGTLVAMRKPWALRRGSAISLQVGRTVLSLSTMHLDGQGTTTTAPCGDVDGEVS